MKSIKLTPLSRLDHIQKIFFEKSVQKIQTRTSSFRLWLMLIIDFIEYLFLEPIHEWVTIAKIVQIGTHLFGRNSRKTKFLRYKFCTLLAWFFMLSFACTIQLNLQTASHMKFTYILQRNKAIDISMCIGYKNNIWCFILFYILSNQ